MKCRRCGLDLRGGKGAYRWRCEVAAIGEDISRSASEGRDFRDMKEEIYRELASRKPEEIDQDVYQLWEGKLCRSCREELRVNLERFLRV